MSSEVCPGLCVFMTPRWLKGRPIHTFNIETPGLYEIGHLSKDVSIYFLPDYMTGNEDLIAISYLSQLAILLAIAGTFYQRKAKVRAEKIREVKNLKKIREHDGKQFWQGYQEDPITIRKEMTTGENKKNRLPKWQPVRLKINL